MAEPDRERVAALMAEAVEVGLVLHLGAGDAPEVDAWRTGGASHVALVEANPVLARTLRQRFGTRADVSVHDCAVAGADGTGVLQVYNLMGLSALRPPADLAALFPGLRRVAGAEVVTMRPSRLLETLPPAGTAPDVLIIDIPGEEATALRDLAEAGALQRFRHILLRCGTTEHYLGSSPATDLCTELETSGYQLTHTDSADPDRPWFAFRLDAAQQEIKALREALAAERDAREAAIAELRAERDAMAAHAAELGAARDAMATRVAELDTERQAAAEARDRIGQERDAAIAELRTERDAMAKRIAELEVECQAAAEARDAREAAIAELRAERDAMAAHAAELGAARDAMATRIAELQTERDALQTERDAMAARTAELDAERQAAAEAREAAVAELQAERDAMASRIAELEAECQAATETRDRVGQEHNAMAAHAAELGAARDAMAAERDRISQSLSEAQAAHAEQTELLRGDAALAVRLQAMREADLRDLQRRHARLTAEKEQQDSLLHKLTERLTLAAQYLQELELSAPERLPPEQPQPADTALTALGEDVAKAAPRKKPKKGPAKARGKSERKSAR